MARYICKCGRVVNKSTNADNTGNRNTDGCEGCPYLLPWGPFAYKPGDGYVMDVKGKECRMSPSIDYASTYYGSADDKCTLRIADFPATPFVAPIIHRPDGTAGQSPALKIKRAWPPKQH